MNATERELLDFVSNDLLDGNGAGLDLDTPLLELRILDSLTIVRLYAFVERHYGLRLDGGVASPAAFATIRALSHLIETRRAAL